MRILKAFVFGITRFNQWVGKCSRVVPLFLLVLQIMGIFFRYALNSPIVWEMEILAYVFNGYFLLGGGFVLLVGGFVRMDLFYSKWNVKTRAIVDACTFPLIAFYLYPLILKGLYYAYIAFICDERWMSAAATPLYPYKFIFALGCILLLLQATAFLINDLYVIIKGSPIIDIPEYQKKEKGIEMVIL